MYLNEKIIELLKSQFVDLIGFADLKNYKDELINFGGNIVKDYKSGISFGIRIPDSIVDFLPQKEDDNIACEYRTHGYEILNQRLNLITSMLSSFLNQKDYRTLPVPAAKRTDQDNAVPTVSHKMIAHIAGLGWIGKNCLLITKQYGPRIRFSTLLTNAPLKTIDMPMEQNCNDCIECIKACPAKAIKGRNYVPGESREERLDFLKCQNYFNKLKKARAFAVCGMCLYSCPCGTKEFELTGSAGINS